jgi:hypothetical protein
MCSFRDGFELLLNCCYAVFGKMRIMEHGASQYMYGCVNHVD